MVVRVMYSAVVNFEQIKKNIQQKKNLSENIYLFGLALFYGLHKISLEMQTPN